MKTADHFTSLSNMPFKLFLYGKALTKRDNPKAEDIAGKLGFRFDHHRVDISNLNRYRTSCGYSNNGQIPATYPFVIGFPLIMKIMTSPQFPVAALGLVHYKNQITQYAAIAETSTLSVACTVFGDRATPLGRIFDIRLELYVADQLVWESVCCFLKKAAIRTARVPSKAEPQAPLPQEYRTLTATPFMALNYAFISGDLNPIHMHKYLARLFGFNSAIIHGMWSKARVIAALDKEGLRLPAQIDVQFQKPILLPAKMQLLIHRTASLTHFNLTDQTQKISHLTGTVRHLNSRIKENDINYDDDYI